MKDRNEFSYAGFKKLEELFAWAEFYKVNKQTNKFEGIQKEIMEQRKKLFNN